jgi:mono/diheme cytochrome c family protein
MVWILALWSALAGCASRTSDSDTSAPAPVDTGVATPPITPAPSPAPVDTPPGSVQQPDSGEAAAAQQADSGQQQGQASQVSQAEYEGWRQYSVHCARCHGQDVLPNPVAANLLVSLAPGGPMEKPATFTQVVSEGRTHRGMPAFKGVLSPEQIQAVYAYVKGRADKRIPPGRPAQPGG